MFSLFSFVLEESYRWVLLRQSDGEEEIPFFYLILENCKYGLRIALFGWGWYVCLPDTSWEFLGVIQYGSLLIRVRALSSGQIISIAKLRSSVGKIGTSHISPVSVLTRSGIGVEICKLLVALPVCSSFSWCVLGKLGYFGTAPCSCLVV